MNIDKRLNEMEPKDTPLLVLGYIILSMFLLIPLSANADDNEVFLGNITGDDLILDISQAGTNNLITGITDTSVLNGDDNTLYIKQQGTGHVFQGNWQWGGNNAGPHHLANIITGDYNDVDHRQLGKSGHDGFIEIIGDNNDVVLYQRGNGGVKWADVLLTGDGHSVDINQRGSNNATATVDLTYGTGAYNFDLSQNVGSSAVSYSITGICNTIGGCSVSINQDN